MKHPYREPPLPAPTFREWSRVTGCSCCVRRAALARMQRRRLWRIAAVSLLGLCAGWTAMALLCVRITGRMVSAVEQLDGVAMATNTAHAAAPPPVCDHSPPPAPPVEPQWPVGLGLLKLGETEFLVAGDVRPSAELRRSLRHRDASRIEGEARVPPRLRDLRARGFSSSAPWRRSRRRSCRRYRSWTEAPRPRLLRGRGRRAPRPPGQRGERRMNRTLG